MMIMCCLDAVEEQLLITFRLVKSIHLTHFSQYSNFLALENLKKPYTLAQNGTLAQIGFTIIVYAIYD